MLYALLYFGLEDEDPSGDDTAAIDAGETVVELLPTTTAVTVRPSRAGYVVVDGPVRPGPPELLGLRILECADLAEAIAQAQLRFTTRAQACEIRPLAPSRAGRARAGPTTEGC